MGGEEGERALPRVGRLGGELLLLAVEERVRGPRVGDDLVLDARVRERLLECRDLLRPDRVVVAAISASTGAEISPARWIAPGSPLRSPGVP